MNIIAKDKLAVIAILPLVREALAMATEANVRGNAERIVLEIECDVKALIEQCEREVNERLSQP